MDFSLNSSVVLAAIVGLWLIWVAPYLLTSRKPALLMEPVAIPVLVSPANAESPVSQGSIMEMSGPSNHAPGGRTIGAASAAAVGKRPLTIRRGRTAVAAIGALALVMTVVGFPLAAFTTVSAVLPGIALVMFVAALMTLRFLAVRDRRRRVDEAFAEAISPRTSDVPAASPHQYSPQRETALFDAESAAREQGAAAAPAAPLTALELRQAALAVAAQTGDQRAEGEETPVAAPATPWQPIDVPKPMYVAAAKAERQAPAPLELPEAPKPQSKTSLKQGAVAPAVATAAAPTSESTPSQAPATQASPGTGRLNLDDVLQRRRA